MIFSFKNPKKNKIAVFDGLSIHDLRYVLKHKIYTVIEVRKNRIDKIFCGANFILSFIINFFFLIGYTRDIFTIYLYTLIKKINPKLLITSIDNSARFSELSKLLSNQIKFIAIQNANRFDYSLNDFFFKKKIKKKNFNKIYNIPYFFCFGEHEIVEAKKYNLKIDNFYKIGSIRLANFFEYVKEKKIKLVKDKYDICLVSEPWHLNKLISNTNLNRAKSKFINIVKHTIKYVRKNKLKFVFLERFKNKGVWKNRAKSELNFYKNYLDDSEYKFIIRNKINKKNNNESYFALLQSKVAIASQSTLLREKFGCQQKILSIPLFRNKIYDFPVGGICKLKNYDFPKFESSLNNLLKMPVKQYLKKLDKPTNYLMEFNKKDNAVAKIRNKINLIINNNLIL